MDFTTISTALAGIKTASDIAKAIKDAEISVEQAEVKLKIADLISALSDAKMSIAEVRELLQEKEGEIKELNSKLETQQKLQYVAPYYWLIEDEKRDGPYCQLCYDKEKSLIRLQETRTGLWACNCCNSKVKDTSYTPPQSKVITTNRFR
jgi:ribosomal protein L37AE/L43A